MRKFPVLVLCALLASKALAQDVTVRGGEHNGFTRLVLSAGDRFTWSQHETDARIIEFRLPETTRINLTEAFARISRTRVANLVATGNGRLQVTLTCDCKVRAQDVASGLVAIDIIGQETRAVAIVRPVARPRSAPQKEQTAKQEVQEIAPEIPVVFLRRDPVPGSFEAVPLDVRAQLDPKAPAVEEFEDDLLLQLSQAVAEGLLSPSASASKKKDPPEVEVVLQEVIQTEALTECLPSSSVSIRDWSTDEGFSQQIATLRRQQASQFDTKDTKDLEKLVRLYLHYGMGAEARLAAKGLREKDQLIYNGMAAVFDGSPELALPAFGVQTSCETDAVLWGILSQPDEANVEFLSETSVLHAFDHLPDHLRQLLAPDLVRKLSLWGFGSTAQAILTRMGRMSEDLAPELQLSAAAAMARGQDADGAEDILKDLARHDDGTSAKALEALIENGFVPDPEVDADLIELAAAHATERRGTPYAQDAVTTDLLAALRTGDFERAFKGIDENDISAPELLNEALLRLSDKADPARFLRYLRTWEKDSGPTPAPKPAAAAIRRLLDLGFPDIAMNLLKRSGIDPANRTLKLLQAEAQFDLEKFEDAEITLIGLTGEDVDTLRAEIRAALGDHAFVTNPAVDAPQTATRRSALLSENWDRLATDENGILSDFANWITTDEPVEEELSLTGAQAQLDNSKAARDQLRALLDLTRLE